MKVDGRCHCGSIAYEAEIDPGAVYFCHCEDCQSLSGGTGRWAVGLPAGAFRLLSGTLATYVKISARGAENHQRFCGTCGSPIYSVSPDRPDVFRLRLGTCTQRAALPPKTEVWCRSSQSWAELGAGTEKRERQ